MTEMSLGMPARLPALSLTRRAAMRGVSGTMMAALAGVGGFGQERVAAQSDAASPVATPGQPLRLSDATLTAFATDVEAAMQTIHIPGAAVALVVGNEIVFNRGFGTRDLESGEPVTPRT